MPPNLGDLILDQLEAAWVPQPGRQAQAYSCEADVLFYGGAAGGGKTDLLLGTAHTAHEHSIIFRRTYPELAQVERRAEQLFRPLARYNGADHLWTFGDGRTVEFGAVQLESDVAKYQGRPHDLKAYDEITAFSEFQFRFLCGWLRTDKPGQRCRVICTGNPPTTPEGEWVVRFWAPWLDERHPNPAAPGELRWFAMVDGHETELASGEPFEHDGETIYPLSRTFIPAKLSDNPIYEATGYRKILQALPEPLRSQMLKGDFGATQDDDIWQVIPTEWVRAAQARWTPEPPGPMDALGVDVARGGRDKTVLTPRHANWFGIAGTHPGKATPDGQAVVGLVVQETKNCARKPLVMVDVIGVGYSVVDIGRENDLQIVACNGAASTPARDRSNNFGFLNNRAWWWWSLREALDPASGEDLALPPDPELLSDLTAARWRMSTRGVQVESKDEIRARIGRSPDKGDSLVYAAAPAATAGSGWGWVQYALAETRGGALPAPTGETDGVPMMMPADVSQFEMGGGAVTYLPGPDRRFHAKPEHVRELTALGCRRLGAALPAAAPGSSPSLLTPEATHA